MRTVNLKHKIFLSLFTLALLVGGATVVDAHDAGTFGDVLVYKSYKLDSSGKKVEVPRGVFYIGDTVFFEPVNTFPSARMSGAPNYKRTDYLLESQEVSLPGQTFPGQPDDMPSGLSLDPKTGIFSGKIVKPDKDQPNVNPPTFNYGITVSETSSGNITVWNSHSHFQFSVVPRPCALTTPGASAIRAPEPDPVYVATTTANRKFTPIIPVNPFDDFIIDIDMTNCPVADTYTSSITTTNASGTPVTVLTNPVNFTRLQAIEKPVGSGNYVYEWKIKGWPGGIVTDKVMMETLVDSIVKKRPINVSVKKIDNSVTKTEPFTMSRCVRIYGNGNEGIAYLDDIDLQKSPDVILANVVRNVDYFNSMSPFAIINPKTQTFYKYLFKHTLDLEKYNRPGWTNPISSGSTGGFLDSKTDISDLRACASISDTIALIANFNVYSGMSDFNIRRLLVGTVFFDTNKKREAVFLHEFGHAFAGLSDEYLFFDVDTNSGNKWRPKNCSIDPASDFSYGNPPTDYAPLRKLGCNSNTIILGKKSHVLYRPSNTSVMDKTDMFLPYKPLLLNVISCGWMLNELTHGASAHSFFPECAAMPGIEK